MVGDDGVDLVDVGNVAEAAFVELRAIEHQNHLASLGNHGLIEHCLFHIGSRDTVFERERVHAEEKLVVGKMAERIERERANGRMGVESYMSTKHDDGKALILNQFFCDIHRVGENGEIGEAVEVPSNLQSGCTRIQQDMIAVLDELSCHTSDTFFFTEIKHTFLSNRGILVEILNGTTDCSTSCAHQEIAVLQIGEILADSNFGDSECFAQRGNRHFILLLEHFHDQCPALFG